MQNSIAIDIAQNSLLFIMQNEDESQRFIANTGLDTQDIRDNFNDKDFLRGVVEYVLGWEPLCVAIAEQNQIDVLDFKKSAFALGSVIVE